MQNKQNFGFTPETEVWCSAGFYKTMQELGRRDETFMSDSFDKDSVTFVTNKARMLYRGEATELIEITYGGKLNIYSESKDVIVRCTTNQEFLTCYENNGCLHYKNETLLWKKASDLKVGTRLVAEDANLVIKSIRKLELVEPVPLYSVGTEEEQNFSIKLGVIVRGE